MTSDRSRSTPFANAALLLGTLALLLPLAELVVRVAAPQTLPSQSRIRSFTVRGMYVADEAAGFRPAPNFEGAFEHAGVTTRFRTNSIGLRDDEITPKTPEMTRVLVLGDSFVWGWGAPQGEEWVSLVERMLREKRGAGRIDVVNAGVNAYGTEAQVAHLERLGPELRPDVVLVAFFTNDFTDNLLGAKGVYTVKDGYLFDRFSHEYFRENVLARESHLYRLATRALAEIRRRLFRLPPAARPVREFTEADFDEGMRLSEKHMLRMRDVCDSLGARFAVVWLHVDVYVTPREDPDVPVQRELQARIAAAGIPSFDTLPVLRSEGNRAGLFIPNDGHFTGRGNRVAARAIAKWLEDSGLLDEGAAGLDAPGANGASDAADDAPGVAGGEAAGASPSVSRP